MRRTIAAAALCLLALPALADSPLKGQWKVTVPKDMDYAGVVSIDADNRAIWSADLDNGRPASYRGYVSRIDSARAEITLTDGAYVAKAYCAVLSSDLLDCRNVRGDGSQGDPYKLTRTRHEMGKLWQR